MSPVSYRDLHTVHARPSFPWTSVVSQRLGAAVALLALRWHMSAASLTVGSLVIGVGTSSVAFVLLGVDPRLAGVVAFVGWQVGYAFDCADGQVARASGTTSAAGARLDVTVDFATSLAMAAVLASAAHDAGLPVVVVTTATAAWLFPIFDEVSGRDGDASTPTLDRASPLYVTLGLVRDGGVHKGLAAVGVGLGATASAIVLVGLGALWLLLLLARVTLLVRRSSTG